MPNINRRSTRLQFFFEMADAFSLIFFKFGLNVFGLKKVCQAKELENYIRGCLMVEEGGPTKFWTFETQV